MRKYLALLFMLSCLHVATRGQTLEEIDLSGLPQPTQAQSLRFWFDNDAGSVQITDNLTGTYTLDVATLPEGLHTLYCQIIDSENTASSISSRMFLKVGDTGNGPAANHLCYWFDDETTIQNIEITDGVQILDASALTEGLHTLHYQVLCNNGMMTPAMSSLFMKVDNTQNTSPKGFRYWFDDDFSSVQVTNGINGTMSLDASHLTTGLHTVYYQIVENNDKVGTPVARIFFKDFDIMTEDGNNRITKYQYWQNENSTEMETVNLDNAANPYQMFGLLPMQSVPIRSSFFHFEVNDGVPRICAKNVFHVRFHDARGYFVDNQKSFVDQRMAQDVTPIGELQPQQTFDRVAENDIRWYTLNVEPGDTVAFKTSQACSIQLFSPSGKEVYNAIGSTSVAFGGCHTWESGTYYLAIHDVKGSQSQITLDYMHMDKYDVVRQDVSVVGNGGCSTITFEGNGFKDLYAVELKGKDNEIINCLYIDHQSDATVGVDFDFLDVNTGIYDAIFHFVDEDKSMENLITVEDAVPIELEVEMDYSSTILVGEDLHLNISIINKGNSTAYNVPVKIVFKSSIGNITRITFTDKKTFKSAYDRYDKTDMTKEELDVLKAISDRIADTNDFMTFINEEKNEESKETVIKTNIPPNGKTKVPIKVENKKKDVPPTDPNPPIKTKAEIPKKWNSASPNNKQQAIEMVCCYANQLACWGDKVTQSIDVLSAIASFTPASFAMGAIDCAANIVNTGLKVPAFVGGCSMPGYENPTWEYFRQISNKVSWGSALPACLSMIPGVKAFQVLSIGFTAFNAAATNESCYEVEKQDCSQIMNGTSSFVRSMDPNEIIGYTADSGSKAVKDGKTDVYYTIEFENDPEFATASAHDVYVTDVLDASKFDLSTFAPTRVKIGDKTAELSGDPNFVTTIDMRPDINAIAQVEGTFDVQTGTASWHISSLDPMTMEPTEEVMDGVLPVNTNGQGIGELSFDISLKEGLAHGTEITNNATIVFDTNEAIATPTWTNIIDRIAPESHITNVEQVDDNTATVSIEATDELSGPWRYDVYVQYGEGSAWWKAAENVPIGTAVNVKIYGGINHGFYVAATYMAGNVEQKESAREFTLDVHTAVLDEESTDTPVTATNVDVRVKRTINANEWSTICLPFAMSEEQVTDVFGDDVQLGDFSGCDTNGDNILVNFTDVTTIEANHPYIIKVSSPIDMFMVEDVDLLPITTPVVQRDEKSGVYNRFVGNYINGTIIPDAGVFLYNNKFYFSNGSTRIKGLRAYFDFEAAGATYSNASRMVIAFDGTTGIKDVKYVSNDKIYNLNGQQVKTLSKGIYVKDGKKVIIKKKGGTRYEKDLYDSNRSGCRNCE